MEGRPRDVFDAFHQLDELVVVRVVDRGKADATVPKNHRGHAMPRRWLHAVVPRRLTVVVRMYVYEPWRDQGTIGINLSGGRAINCADFGNDAVGHGHVSLTTRHTSAINHSAATDNQIMGSHTSIMSGKAARTQITECRHGESYVYAVRVLALSAGMLVEFTAPAIKGPPNLSKIIRHPSQCCGLQRANTDTAMARRPRRPHGARVAPY